MIEINFTPKTIRLLTKFVATADKSFNSAVARGLRKTGEFAQRRARHFSPKKTSTLQGSIQILKRGDSIIVGTNKEYARIHEFGGTFTRNSAWGRATKPYTVTYKKFKGRGYFKPAFNETIAFGKKTMDKEINKFLTEISK